MSLSDELRDELAHDRADAAAAAASPSSRRSSTPPVPGTSRRDEVAVHLDLVERRGRAPRVRAAARRSASARRSAPTAGARSTTRRATSCTSTSTTPASAVLREAGVLSARGAPLERPPKRVVGRSCCRGAYLRGALLGAGSLSGPRDAASRAARDRRSRAPSSSPTSPRARACRSKVVERRTHAVAYAKGHETIADLLALAGAGETALRLDEHAVVAATRAEANRLANADEANVKRTVRAAQRQLEAIRAARRRRAPAGAARDRRAAAPAPVRLARASSRPKPGRRSRRRPRIADCEPSMKLVETQ